MPRVLRTASRFALAATTATTLPALYLYHRTATDLESRYPPCSPQTSSTPALYQPPDQATQHTPCVDIYSARVPARGLLAQHKAALAAADDPHGQGGDAAAPHSLEDAWARAFFQSPALKLESRFIALSRDPGDCGARGFAPGQPLLHGLFRVERAPAPGAPLLAAWAPPPTTVAFFERIARWGYPWRLMDGGRHEFGVGAEVDADGTVEVRFSCAHDYRWVAEEGEMQKTVPEWVKRAHRVYAMWLLDERVKAVKRRAEEVDRERDD